MIKPPVFQVAACIVSTNVAETSVTIDGIVYVIDCGLVRRMFYNPRCRVNSLLMSPASRASARQRAGCAGRTQPGECYRLYTQDSFKRDLIDQEYPEIMQSNIQKIVVDLKVLGVRNPFEFDFLDHPGPETMF
ncbi:hypothetical protein NKR23_g6249 [Pleurostoma richardsiae]|uniref:RNA helicase n=1 Tax=Pleurostoma richardsiae TaxID=41990 RepID=A0AA38RZ68_9PEZI|nr:hypothetical protein NKR23_g6249 [Pleurostoma richardsiae]